MFSIFRDSLFQPKRLIEHRKKKWIIIILYTIILSFLACIGILINGLKYKGLDAIEMNKVVEVLDGKGLKITDENGFEVNNNCSISLYEIDIIFVNEDTNLEELDISKFTSLSQAFLCYGKDVYLLTKAASSYQALKIKDFDFSKIPDGLKNIEFDQMSSDPQVKEQVRIEINKILMSFVPIIVSISYVFASISCYATIWLITLLGYFVISYAYKAKGYMKPNHILKIVQMSLTWYLLLRFVLSVLPFELLSILRLILVFVSFVPFYIVSREIGRRVNEFRIKEMIEKMASEQAQNNDMNDVINDDENNDDNQF